MNPESVTAKTGVSVIVKAANVQVEFLSEYYDKVFRPANALQPVPTLPIPLGIMDIPVFTLCLVHKVFSTLDTSKYSGPDKDT